MRSAAANLVAAAIFAAVSCPGMAADGRAITDYKSATDAVTRVMVEDLGLPVPPPQLEIYPTREAFAAGLVEHLKVDAAMAERIARFGQAAVSLRVVLVNAAVVDALTWPQRIEMLAHEITHTVQGSLAGKSVNRLQWITEGWAEWVAYETTAKLGLHDFGVTRAALLERVRKASATGGLPRIRDLNSFDQWIAAREKYGFDGTFSFAFFMIEFLAERHSAAKIVEYYRQLATSATYAAAFRSTFGESVSAFEAAFDTHFRVLAGIDRVESRAAGATN